MSSPKKFVCIHGHFYQPPRENAWLEVVEMQDSAQPFHDWNERINYECYAPNTAARILDDKKQIIDIVNNYTRISFNFGPTLLSWIEAADPATYLAMLLSDQESQPRFDGHGSAIAQVHSHLILPLTNARDRQTQVIWGIRDFIHRFGRRPEGMWLSETAVNTDTLETLAAQGIRYTILAPRQAKALRRIGDADWRPIQNEQFDTRMPYRCLLPSGKEIALFFYDGAIAQEVAFKGILNNGKAFAERLLSNFDSNDEPQLVHIATDGESYGHHHRYGEMALADALKHIAESGRATITNYGEYLSLFPPTFEMQIHENSSWSCVHGVERWRSNCGCNTGGRPGWNQEWRGPLRAALDWLRDQMMPVFEEKGAGLMRDPWIARDDYIVLLLNRSKANVEGFFKRHARKKLSKEERVSVLRLLEMQRNAMLMYTSCGWFFDEVSGIETIQILQYALRAIDYHHVLTGKSLQSGFESQLEAVPSNVYQNAAEGFRLMVIPTRVGLVRAAMHYAVSSVFEKNPEELALFNYFLESEYFTREENGVVRLAIGRSTMHSKVTFSETRFSFAVLYQGQQSLTGYISTDLPQARYDEMEENLLKAFKADDIAKLIRLMKEYLGGEEFTFDHIFRDQRRNILKEITSRSMQQAEEAFRDIYNNNYQLMIGLTESHIPIPKTYQDVAQFIVNLDIHRFFRKKKMHIKDLQRLAKELIRWDISVSNEDSFRLAASERIAAEIRRIDEQEASIDQLTTLIKIIETLQTMGMQLDIWRCQNYFFSIASSFREGERQFPNEEWKEAFLKLGSLLQIKVDSLVGVAG